MEQTQAQFFGQFDGNPHYFPVDQSIEDQLLVSRA
jgi:hypothetical protein